MIWDWKQRTPKLIVLIFVFLLYPGCQPDSIPRYTILPLKTAISPQTPHAAGTVTSEPSGDQIHLSIQLTQPAIRTQGFNTAEIHFVRVNVRGASSDLLWNPEGFVSIENANNTNIQIHNVPRGKNRIVTAQGYDANKDPIPWAVVKGYYSSPPYTSSVNVNLNWRNKPVGQILDTLRNQSSSLAESIDTTSLQSTLDKIIFNGNNSNPETSDAYFIHPSRLDIQTIEAALQENLGILPTIGNLVKNPEIKSISAIQGLTGTIVTISGSNFDPIPSNNTVLFNETNAWVLDATDTTISVMVPADASEGKIKVMTSGNYSALGSSFLTIPPPGLISRWKGEGDSQDDKNTNPGVVNGATYISAKNGQGFNFDGINDNIDMGLAASTDFNSNQDFTLSTWVRPSAAKTGAIISKESINGDGYNLILTQNQTLAFVVGGTVKNGLLLNLDASNTNSYPGAGTNWLDLSGLANHGALQGSAPYLQASSPISLKMEQNNRVFFTENAGLRPPKITMDYFGYLVNGTKSNPTWPNPITQGSAIISYARGSTPWYIYYLRHLSDTNSVAGKIIVGGNIYTVSSTITKPTWTHLGVTYDADTLKLYVDGNLSQQDTSPSGNLDYTGAGQLNIGTWNNNLTAASFSETNFNNNTAAVVRLYNRDLTASEVEQNYHSVAYRGGLLNSATTTDTIPLNVFTHVAVKKEGTTCFIYINGVESKNFTCGLTQNMSGTLKLGARASGVQEYFQGTLDDIQMYNRALNNTEIQAIYDLTK